MQAKKNYEVRTPNSVENTGLDSAVFATRKDAESALRVLAAERDISKREIALCSVVETDESANTTFEAWNEKGW